MRYTVIKSNGKRIEHYHTDGSNDRNKAWEEAVDKVSYDNYLDDGDWHVVAIVTGQHEVYSSEDFQVKIPNLPNLLIGAGVAQEK